MTDRNMPANRARQVAARAQAQGARLGESAEPTTHDGPTAQTKDGATAHPVPGMPGVWIVGLGLNRYGAVRLADGVGIGEVDATKPHTGAPGWSLVARLLQLPDAMDAGNRLWAHVPVHGGHDGEPRSMGRDRQYALSRWEDHLVDTLDPAADGERSLAQRAEQLAAERIAATRAEAAEQARADAQALLAAFPDEGPLDLTLPGISRIEQLWRRVAAAGTWDQVAAAMRKPGTTALDAILDQRRYCVMRLTTPVGAQVLPMQMVQREIRRAAWIEFLVETEDLVPAGT